MSKNNITNVEVTRHIDQSRAQRKKIAPLSTTNAGRQLRRLIRYTVRSASVLELANTFYVNRNNHRECQWLTSLATCKILAALRSWRVSGHLLLLIAYIHVYPRVGGLCGAIVTSPFDVVKTRLQSSLFREKYGVVVGSNGAAVLSHRSGGLLWNFVETGYILR